MLTSFPVRMHTQFHNDMPTDSCRREMQISDFGGELTRTPYKNIQTDWSRGLIRKTNFPTRMCIAETKDGH
jgi:hypothetical protein